MKKIVAGIDETASRTQQRAKLRFGRQAPPSACRRWRAWLALFFVRPAGELADRGALEHPQAEHRALHARRADADADVFEHGVFRELRDVLSFMPLTVRSASMPRLD